MSQPYPLLRISRPLQARLLGPCAETLSRSAMLFSLMVLLSLLTTCYSLVPLTLDGHPGLFNSEHPWPRFVFFPKLLLETMEIKGYSQSHWIRVRRLGGQKKKKKIVGVQISLSRWEEGSDLQFYCPRTTVYMKYSRSGFTPRKGTETEHKLNPHFSISKSHLQISQTLIHLNLFVLHLYLLEPLFLYPPTRL